MTTERRQDSGSGWFVTVFLVAAMVHIAILGRRVYALERRVDALEARP